MGMPRAATIKRLFAVSGNRCAFIKCPCPLIHDGKVTGRICHIKGARPGSARYDADQSDDDRHSFENLILMCPLHHDAIDADEVVYSVDRLKKLKADHEKIQRPTIDISDSQTQQLLVFSSLIGTIHGDVKIYNQNVSSANQHGGITAHTVNIGAPRRVMGDEMKKGILKSCPRDKEIIVWSVVGDQETQRFAEEIFSFMRRQGFDLFGDGPTGNVFIGTPPKGVVFISGDPRNNLYVGYPDGSERPRGSAN